MFDKGALSNVWYCFHGYVVFSSDLGIFTLTSRIRLHNFGIKSPFIFHYGKLLEVNGLQKKP